MDANRKLTRSNKGMIAGVCEGIANHFDWDPTLVRVAYILMAVLTAFFPCAIAYLLLWIVMPKEGTV